MDARVSTTLTLESKRRREARGDVPTGDAHRSHTAPSQGTRRSSCQRTRRVTDGRRSGGRRAALLDADWSADRREITARGRCDGFEMDADLEARTPAMRSGGRAWRWSTNSSTRVSHGMY